MTVLNLGGLPHPPGYPLYVIIGRVFCSMFPFGTPAFKASLLSAIFAGITISLLYSIVKTVNGNTLAALLASGIFAVSRLFWQYATVAEVFSLAALTTALIVYSYIKTLKDCNNRLNYFIFGLSFSIGIAHHHSVLFLFPLIPLLFWHTVKEYRSLGRVLPVCILFLSGTLPGFAVYGALPFFDGPWKFSTVNSLIDIYNFFMRKSYGTLSTPITEWWNNAIVFVRYLPGDFYWAGFVAGLFGIITGINSRHNRFWSLSIIVCFVLSGPFFLSLFDQPSQGRSLIMLERFYIMPHLLFSIYIGMGFHFFQSTYGNVINESVLKIAVAGFLLIAALGSYPKSDHANWTVLEDYCNNSFSVIEKNAIVVGHGDTEFSGYLYMQSVLQKRSDIVFLAPSLVQEDWYQEFIKENHPEFVFPENIRSASSPLDMIVSLINHYSTRCPVYVSLDYWNDSTFVQTIPPVYPYHGILLKVTDSTTTQPNLDSIRAETEQAMQTFTFHSLPRSPYDYSNRWEGLSYYQYAKSYRILSELFIKTGDHKSAQEMKRISLHLAQPWINF